jgi:hypothetical protein
MAILQQRILHDIAQRRAETLFHGMGVNQLNAQFLG